MSKNIQIQFLRGVLCLFVLIFHYTYQYCNLYNDINYFDNFILENLGSFAVMGFILLNGLFIFRKEKENESNKTKIIYWLKRFLKIYVYYVFAILLIFICLTLANNLKIREVSLSILIKNIFMLNFFEKVAYIDGAHWYLFYLLIFYFWTFIFDLFKRQKNFLSWFILLLINIVSFVIKTEFTSTLFGTLFKYLFVLTGSLYLPMFLIGISFKLIINNSDKKDNFILILVCLIVLFIYEWKSAVFAIILLPIIYLIWNKKLIFTEKVKPIIFIGNYSLSIYLTHQIIGYIIIRALITCVPYFVCFLIAFVNSIIIGYLFEKLLKKLMKIIFKYIDIMFYINKKI